MPIYAYRCASCGVEKDVLQKFSDAPLTVCPACAAESFQRVLTAPAFQLKGSGWYVTDFRDGNKAKAASGAGESGSRGDAGAAKSGDAKSGEAKSGEGAGGAAKASESSTASAGTTASGTA